MTDTAASQARIKAHLQKLLNLARTGVGGEKDNAASILGKLLKKHNLTLDDLDPEGAPVTLFEFSYKNELEHKLLMQVVFNILNVSVVSGKSHPHRNGRKVLIEMTRAQKLEVDLAYGLYRDAFRKEQERLLKAFVHKNNLYGPSPQTDLAAPPPPPPMAPEELATILAMIEAIKPTTVHRAIAAQPDGGKAQ